MRELTVPEMREIALSYVLQECTRRAVKQEPELASLTDDQLLRLIDDLLNAGRHRQIKVQGLKPDIDRYVDAPLDCEAVAQEPGKTVRGKTKLS